LEHIANSAEEELANIPGISAEMAGLLRVGADDLMTRREAGEDIRPAAVFPEGYDPEIEWSRWPADEDLLGRDLFDRCVRMGCFTLETIAEEDSPESFARLIGKDVETAVATIYAAKDALATLANLSSTYGETPAEPDAEATDAASASDDATVIEVADAAPAEDTAVAEEADDTVIAVVEMDDAEAVDALDAAPAELESEVESEGSMTDNGSDG